MFASLTVVTVAVARTVLSAVDHDARRLRRVECDPRTAIRDDIEALIRAHGVREDKVWSVIDRLEAADLEPALVWAWTMKYDGTELADLCRSRLTHDEVRAHLVNRTVPVELDPAAGACTA